MTRLILLAILVFGASCGKDEAKPDPSKKEPASGAPPATTDSKVKETAPTAAKPAVTEFVSTEHKFSVMSKQKPRISNPTGPAGSGTITSYMFSSSGAPGAYMILVAPVPLTDAATEADLKKALTNARDGIMTKYAATISSDQEFMIGDHHGRDFSFSASHPQMGPMAGRSKVIARGSQLYQVMRVGKPDAAALIAEADAMIDSFKFTE